MIWYGTVEYVRDFFFLSYFTARERKVEQTMEDLGSDEHRCVRVELSLLLSMVSRVDGALDSYQSALASV